MKNNIQMSLFSVALAFASAGVAVTAQGEVNPYAIEVFDHGNTFVFGVLNTIPIDTQFIEPSVYRLLDSCTADSAVKISPVS